MQLQRKPKKFPILTINREVKSIDDFKFDDFTLTGYNPYPKISMDMAVWKGYRIWMYEINVYFNKIVYIN